MGLNNFVETRREEKESWMETEKVKRLNDYVEAKKNEKESWIGSKRKKRLNELFEGARKLEKTGSKPESRAE